MKITSIFITFCLVSTMGICFLKSSDAAQIKEGPGPKEEIIRPKIEYKAQGLKDPFLPLVQEKETSGVSVTATRVEVKPLPVLTLQGLVWGGDFPQAIINNRLVKIGDTIEGVEIVDIGKEGVILLYANKKYKLSSPSVTGSRQNSK